MATNRQTWRMNLLGAREPLVMRDAVAAASALKQGEIIEKTGGGNTQWVPIDSDFNMDSNVAVSGVDKKATTDILGFYPIIVPRPGDVFTFELAASVVSADNALGAALYYSSSEKVTAVAGTNILGRIASTDHYPLQNFGPGAVGDEGTTRRTITYVDMIFVPESSYYSAFEDLNA